MGNEIFLYVFIVCSIIFIALFIHLLRQTIKNRRKAQEEMQKQDLCGTCEHCWEDFPMPLDRYVTQPPIEDSPYIHVVFCKGNNGWISFTGYGCDISPKKTVEFINRINDAADVLNEKEE